MKEHVKLDKMKRTMGETMIDGLDKWGRAAISQTGLENVRQRRQRRCRTFSIPDDETELKVAFHGVEKNKPILKVHIYFY